MARKLSGSVSLFAANGDLHIFRAGTYEHTIPEWARSQIVVGWVEDDDDVSPPEVPPAPDGPDDDGVPDEAVAGLLTPNADGLLVCAVPLDTLTRTEAVDLARTLRLPGINGRSGKDAAVLALREHGVQDPEED